MSGQNGSSNDHEHGDRNFNPVALFEIAKQQKRPLYVSAPMVRYSKLAFRLLVQDYGVDITYTPMILAHEFLRHPVARDSDFSTHQKEGSLIAQFASNNPTEFARAATLISPWVNGVDLNCGCPQSWAIKEGLGCHLISDADKVAAMVVAAKQALGANKSVSVKIRIHKNIDETIALLKRVQDAGVDFVTVHARLRSQRSSTPPDLAALKVIKSHFPDLPMLANGDVNTIADAEKTVAMTGVEGVMTARELLINPALFAGFDSTPREAVEKFMAYAVATGLRFELILHHVNEMMNKMATKKERRALMDARDVVEVIDWLDSRWKVQRYRMPS